MRAGSRRQKLLRRKVVPVVEALYVAGLRQKADDLLLAYWGGMVEKGADTFWEAFVPGDDFASPYGNVLLNSYCHAWSCGPAYLIRNARYRALSASAGSVSTDSSAEMHGARPHVVLELKPTAENPRNSEGDFAVLRDGRILFAYSRFSKGAGGSSADLVPARVL